MMRHVRLALRMGQVTGTDIVSAHRHGRLSQKDWAEMIQNCRGCEWAEECACWLETRDQLVSAPRICPNRKRFAKLKHEQDEEMKCGNCDSEKSRNTFG
ncbi:MAG: DUF6455 family protein [Ruegeria sp.]